MIQLNINYILLRVPPLHIAFSAGVTMFAHLKFSTESSFK